MTQNYIVYNELVQPEEVAPAFDFKAPLTGPVHLSNSLQMTVHTHGLVAISAPQVGLNCRVIYLRGFESAMFNPIIVDKSTEMVEMEEMSGSYMGLAVKIKRHDFIKVRWHDANQNVHTQIFNGITSAAIQRKIDALDGKDFLDAATSYHKKKALKQWRKMNDAV